MSTCQKTAKSGFPHHWKCIQSEGHTGCTCSSTNNYCEAFECKLADESRRYPDGSILAKDHLETGGISCGVYSLGSSGRTIQYVNIPK